MLDIDTTKHLVGGFEHPTVSDSSFPVHMSNVSSCVH